MTIKATKTEEEIKKDKRRSEGKKQVDENRKKEEKKGEEYLGEAGDKKTKSVLFCFLSI